MKFLNERGTQKTCKKIPLFALPSNIPRVIKRYSIATIDNFRAKRGYELPNESKDFEDFYSLVLHIFLFDAQKQVHSHQTEGVCSTGLLSLSIIQLTELFEPQKRSPIYLLGGAASISTSSSPSNNNMMRRAA